MLSRRMRFLRRRGDEKVHLWPSLSFFRHSENDGQRVAQRDGRECGKQVCVLALVPIRGELIRGADEDGAAVERKGLSRLEPCSEGLLGQLLSSAIEQTAPSFVGSQRHLRCCVENQGG